MVSGQEIGLSESNILSSLDFVEFLLWNFVIKRFIWQWHCMCYWLHTNGEMIIMQYYALLEVDVKTLPYVRNFGSVRLYFRLYKLLRIFTFYFHSPFRLSKGQ